MSRRRRGARIELTSLLDVMFLVLVFFIVCIFGMSVRKGVRVELPEATGAAERGERVVITIRADDSLLFNGHPAGRADIVCRMKALSSAHAQTSVILSGDRRASLGTGVELLAELKSVGVGHVSFQVSR